MFFFALFLPLPFPWVFKRGYEKDELKLFP